MPGIVGLSLPAVVFPQTLCTAFTETRDYLQLRATYNDGNRDVGQIANASRRTFKRSSRLSAGQIATLSNFYENLVQGGLQAFLFYNPFEGSPVGSNYDPTGANTTGRYVVRFGNDWSQVRTLSRSEVDNLELVELVPSDAIFAKLHGFTGTPTIPPTALKWEWITLSSYSPTNTGNGARLGSQYGTTSFSFGRIPALTGASPYTNQTDTVDITAQAESLGLNNTFGIQGYTVAFAIQSYGGVTHDPALSVDAVLKVYETYIQVTYPDGTQQIFRPHSVTLQSGEGLITNQALAYDLDPTTYMQIVGQEVTGIFYALASVSAALYSDFF